MARGMSIHIGVNTPSRQSADCQLQYSESNAWRMAKLAQQAGFNALTMLRGSQATKDAVAHALTTAADSLSAGDTLLVTFSGHSLRRPDMDCDERDWQDELWVLSDSELLDDTLATYWRRFQSGVRIVVVAETCYSAGGGRTDEDEEFEEHEEYGLVCVPPSPARGRRGRGTRGEDGEAGDPCIVEPPAEDDGIRASILMLCASGEGQTSYDGVFTRFLLEEWADGAFRGSYCKLYRNVHRKVTAEFPDQHPDLVMLGVPDPELPMAPAFHLDGSTPASRYRRVMRRAG